MIKGNENNNNNDNNNNIEKVMSFARERTQPDEIAERPAGFLCFYFRLFYFLRPRKYNS